MSCKIQCITTHKDGTVEVDNYDSRVEVVRDLVKTASNIYVDSVLKWLYSRNCYSDAPSVYSISNGDTEDLWILSWIEEKSNTEKLIDECIDPFQEDDKPHPNLIKAVKKWKDTRI